MNFLTDSIIIYSEDKINITIHINIFISDIDEECYFELGLLTSSNNKSSKKNKHLFADKI